MSEDSHHSMKEKLDAELARKEREISALKTEIEEVRKLAAVNEKLMLSSIREQERLLDELSKKSEVILQKDLEIRKLKAFNEIVSAASRHVLIRDILKSSLKVIISSLGSLERTDRGEVEIRGGVFLVDEDKEELVHFASQGISRESLGCGGRVAVGECICGLAAESGKVDIVPRCMADPRHTRKPAVSSGNDHAHVCIPLKSGERVLGLLYLYFLPAGYRPLASDVTILTSIGNYLGLRIEKARLYEKVQELASVDGLTGLYNYREFHRRLEHEVNRARRYKKEVSLLMIDIDHFKVFNDRYGHLAGDRVLRIIGRLIRDNVRNVDLPARYGGEEFAVILPDTPIGKAKVVTRRLLASVSSHPFRIGDKVVPLTVSIGMASFPGDADSKEALVEAADRALYHAKSSGRNRVCCFSEARDCAQE